MKNNSWLTQRSGIPFQVIYLTIFLCGSESGADTFNSVTSGMVTSASTSKVGIGTSAGATPSQKLTISIGATAVEYVLGQYAGTGASGNTASFRVGGGLGTTDWAGMEVKQVWNAPVTGQTNNKLGFFTANGTNSTEKMTLDPNGNLGIGITLPTAKLDINATSGQTGTTQIGISNKITGSAAGTAFVMGTYSVANSAASPYTVTNTAAFYAGSNAKGTGSTITNHYGLYMENFDKGTNNFAIFTGRGKIHFGDSLDLTSHMLFAGDLVYSGTNPYIRSNTVDGSDNKGFVLSGGGAGLVSRGGIVAAYGNESGPKGSVELSAGDQLGGNVNLYTHNLLRYSLGYDGIHTFSTPVTMASTLGVAGQSNLTGITLNGGISGPGAIFTTPTIGLAVQGKSGTSYDFSLLGTTGIGSYVLRVPTGTTTAEFPNNVVVGGSLGLSGGAVFSGGSSGQGSIYTTPAIGLSLQAKSGTTYDFSILGTAGVGSYIMRVPTGTTTVEFPNNVVVGGTMTLSSPVSLSSTLGVTGAISATAITASSAITSTQAGAGFIHTGAAGLVRDALIMQTSGSHRWILRQDGTAETGANAGSNFSILARTDAGAGIDAPLSIVRAAGGAISLARPVSITSTLGVTGNTILSGNVAIGTTPSVSTSLDVRNTSNTGTNQYGISTQPTFASGATNSGIALYAALNTVGSYTMGAGRAIYIDAPSVSTTTIATLVGLDIANQTGGLTNYAIRTGAGLVSLGDALKITGLTTATGGIEIMGGTDGPGRVTKSPTAGLLVTGITGSNFDFFLQTPNGNSIMRVPTNTTTVAFQGPVTAASTFSVTSKATVGDLRIGSFTTQYTIPFAINSSGDMGASTGLEFNAVSNTFQTQNGTFSGNLTTTGQAFVGTGGGTSALVVSGAAGTARAMQFNTGTMSGSGARWTFEANNSPESGGNAGSAFSLTARADNGSVIDQPISVIRAAGGAVALSRPVTMASTLAVTGQLSAGSIITNSWGITPPPDYVFDKDYKLASLENVEKFLDKNKHLPEIPSAKEIESKGLDLGEMNLKLLKKVEELTLYAIEQGKRDRQQTREIEKLKAALLALNEGGSKTKAKGN